MAEEFLKEHGCSCCNGHHEEDGDAVKLDAVGTCSCCCDDDDDEVLYGLLLSERYSF